MSDNERVHFVVSKKKGDARVRRTRDSLGDALIALMQEKSFDTITVQDVLDRAHVSRSTFYSHYSDKDDLLMSDAEEFFESISMALSVSGDKSDRVFPVKEFFVHLSDVQPFFKALVKSGKFQENMELARGHFARGIERRLSELPQGRTIPANQLPAIAFSHAGALLSLLTWWLDRGMREQPAEMDELFHRLVWKGVSTDYTESA
ncbi:MAG TPA: TetR/AcrR family transcriptional regulator [Pyrinomonadaceae bacterium]|nr:TetR/AcrR family transcriptional regulator [Pyrinomonadaceae bacterium]